MSSIPNLASARPFSNPVPDLVAVLRAADAQAMFGWSLPADPLERPQLLADTYHARLPHRTVLVVVVDASGLAYGIVPVHGSTYGFTLAAPGGFAKKQLRAPGGFGRYQLRLHQLVTRLAAMTSPKVLCDELTAFGSEGTPRSGNSPEGRDPSGVNVFELQPPARYGTSPDNRTENSSPIRDLLATYSDGTCRWAQAPGQTPPPNGRKIDHVLRNLFLLLFPGYHGPMPEAGGFTAFVLRRTSAIQQQLASLVRRAVRFEQVVNPLDPQVLSGEFDTPEKVVWEFLGRLPEIRRMLSEDVRVAYENDPALREGQHHQVLLAYPGLAATAVYRIAHELFKLNVPHLPRMMTELAHSRYAIDIHPGATIGSGFFCDHGTGVTIGETCVIGEGVTLYQGVTLGALNFPRNEDGKLDRGAKRHPTLEDNVVVYANASVMGNIVVGRSSKIGANVSLRQSTDPESIVRMPLSLRELSISSPQLALEGKRAAGNPAGDGQIVNGSKAVQSAPENRDSEASLPDEYAVQTLKIELMACDPEIGLPSSLLRDEREYRGYEDIEPASP